jgi:signal transduction histidine kinase
VAVTPSAGSSRSRRIARVSARYAAILAACICVIVTLLVIVADLDPDIGNRRFHVGLETADAMVLVFVAAVLLGRFRSDGSRRNRLMLTAVIVLAVKNLFFAVTTIVVDDFPLSQFTIWATAANGLLGAALLAAAAVLPDRRAPRARTTAVVLAPSVAIVASVIVLAAVFEELLPSAFEALPVDVTEMRLLSGHPVKILVDVLTAACYAVAAVAFARLADERDDQFMKWLSISAAIAAIAFVNFALYPSRFTRLFYGGELLWLGAVGALLYGAVREISTLEAALVRSAVLEERRRVARDLHDGVAQELAYISSQTHWFLRQPSGGESLVKIMDAVQRALDESRGAIAALNRPIDEPLELAVEHAALDVADRVGARLQLDLDEDVDVTSDWRDALLRITREAVANAVRHGHARTITLQLRNGDGVSLRVIDDGDGFDPSAPRSGQSFGLTSMRERTESLGGTFTISSAPGQGSSVEVRLP